MAKDSYQIWLQALRKQLAEAALRAEPLVQEGRLDEAEQMVRAVDADIYGAAALGELFTRSLKHHVSAPQRDGARARELYERALRWRTAWPTVHTAEEAERERAHIEEVSHELKALLGEQ